MVEEGLDWLEIAVAKRKERSRNEAPHHLSYALFRGRQDRWRRSQARNRRRSVRSYWRNAERRCLDLRPDHDAAALRRQPTLRLDDQHSSRAPARLRGSFRRVICDLGGYVWKAPLV